MRWPSAAFACLYLLLAVALRPAPAAARPQAEIGSASGNFPALLNDYCVTCHSPRQRDAGAVPLALDPTDLEDVGSHAGVWEKVVRKLRAGLMPPSGAPRPAEPGLGDFTEWLESELDAAAREHPDPGRSEALHRLNRAEYANAVRDLLDLEIDVSEFLPSDDASYGFDNIAGVLGLSPTLMERYLSSAEKISRLAVGTAPPFPAIDYFRVADDLRQEDRLPGFSLGTRGGTRIHYAFPMDAEYTIRVDLARDLNESVPLYLEDHDLEVSIDGERVAVFTLPGVGSPPQPAAAPTADPERPQISQVAQSIRVSPNERAARNRIDETWEVRIPVRAGTRDVQVAFIHKTSAVEETIRLPFLRPYPAGVNIPETRQGAYLRSVEISGPYAASGPGDSPSRRRVFDCDPSASAGADEPLACARSILGSLARRAFRRPVTEADVEPLLAFYAEGAAEGGFEAGIERAVRRLLVSPEFLFRVTTEPEDLPPATAYAIGDVELASRLSFFLWSSIPDEALLRIAEEGRLSDPEVFDAQVRRMVDDPRFDAFVQNFAGQWLFLRNLEATVPVQSIFPDFDDSLRQSMRRETELFFASVIREEGGAFDLLNASYTFLNERLARHYGIGNVRGSHFRRVELAPDSPRRGLLGQGSILTVTSYPDRTSPVVRGKWILENLLGTPPPPPLPNVPELGSTSPTGDILSMRDRMAQHRQNPVCASCHAMMDPLGFALENFDAVGRWRTLGESGTPIDPSGTMPDGTRFRGPDGLRETLAGSELFVVTLTEKMLTYALGRGLDYADQPTVRAIVREAASDDYRLKSLILGVTRSVPFRSRLTREESEKGGSSP